MVRDQGALRSLPSKKHSCSELQKGHQHMLKVKKERESPEELDRKIKEYEDELKALKAAQTADSKAASAVASPDDETQPASPEEVEKARGRARKGKDTQKNAVAEPSEPKTRRTAAKAAPKAMSAPSGRSKSKSDDGSTPESAKKPGGKQPAQPPSKRLRSKSSGDPPAAPPRDPKIADLEKANAKLKKQLEALQKASSASTAKPSSQKRPRTPPSSAAASKKPTFSPQSEDEDGPEDFDIFGTPRYEPSDESGGENEIVGEGEEGEDDEGEGELSESAKNQRLRRICEVKPGTGVCRVPDEIHARWKKGGTERLKLRDELEAAGWDKDEFVNAIIRIKEKTSKFTRHKRRGWYTKEKMKVKLGWSKCLVRICVSHPYKT
ncbi:unnamed protein product [Cladocopium goreaui]|uniref:Uncharacterized protein n=1 Tax=Cladocopium goreaui TaxID=2562237 RepID=A0A9P1CQK7_9DINO|nr:unnamed protein product [Cladocopium goreaui]